VELVSETDISMLGGNNSASGSFPNQTNNNNNKNNDSGKNPFCKLINATMYLGDKAKSHNANFISVR